MYDLKQNKKSGVIKQYDIFCFLMCFLYVTLNRLNEDAKKTETFISKNEELQKR